MKSVTKTTKVNAKGKTTTTKISRGRKLTRREYKLARKQQQYDFEAKMGKEAQKTKRVQAIAGSVNVGMGGAEATATTITGVSAAEKTKRDAQNLINPVVSKNKDDDNQGTASTVDGEIPWIGG